MRTKFLHRLVFLITCLAGTLLSNPELPAAESRYVDNGDGTVKDTLTELIWIKDPEKIPAAMGTMVWIKAKNCCRDLVYADSGPGAWYLPNIKELQSLVEESSRSPRIDTAFFEAVPSTYWSSTDDTGSGMRAWVVQFLNGELQSYPKLSILNPIYARVRCVRRAS